MDLAEAVSKARPVVATKLASGFSWPEIPRWHDGALWFSDMYNHCLVRLAADGTPEKMVDASDRKPLSPEAGSDEPGQTEVVLGGAGWLPDGRLIVNSMHERVVLVWDGTALELYADLRPLAISSINDMVVDADGRAYISQLGFDLFAGEEPRDSEMLVVEPDGSAHALEGVGEFSCGNGIAITADGSRLLIAEVMANRVSVMDRAADGTLSNRRDFTETPFLPDGICLDEQGGVWVAMPGSGYVARLEEGGVMTDAVELPMEQAMGVACVLGGEDRSTLYIAAGLEVFDWAKSRDDGLGTIWTAQTDYTAGASRN